MTLLQIHHHHRAGRPSVQLLPPLVRRHVPGSGTLHPGHSLTGPQERLGNVRPVKKSPAKPQARSVNDAHVRSRMELMKYFYKVSCHFTDLYFQSGSEIRLEIENCNVLN